MSTILLGCLFFFLCAIQWYLSKNSPHFLSHLPTAFYLVITGIVAVRAVLGGNTNPAGFYLLGGALAVLVLIDITARFAAWRERNRNAQKKPGSAGEGKKRKPKEKRKADPEQAA